MNKKLIAVGSALTALSPLAVFAQPVGGGGGAAATGGLPSALIETVTQLMEIITALVPFMLTLAVLFFLWGLAKFVLAAGDEAAKESGRRIMVWGVIAITVMVSLWGLVALLQEIFGVDSVKGFGAPTVPEVPAL